MAQVETPNILGSFLAGQQAGQEQRRRRTLSDFLQPALSGDQNALAKVYSADPDTGLQVQGMAQRQQAATREQQVADLKQAASLYRAAPEPIKAQLYGRIVEGVEGLGLAQAGSLPRTHSPEFDAGFNQFLDAIAGNEQQRNIAVAPGSAIVDPQTGRVVYERPFAPANMQPIQTDEGFASYNPRTGTAAPLNYGDDLQGVYSAIAARNGSQITSGVRPVLPGVGAGANSQHPRGTAADFRTNGLPPQQVAALMGDLRSQGFEVIDERDNRNGRGPHIHAELPSGGRRVMPKQSEAQETYGQPQVVTNPQTGQQELVQFGNRGGRRAVSDFAPPPTSRDAKPPTEGERNAAGYFSRMESAERELDALVNAGHDPTNVRDFYTAGQGPLRNWAASDTGQQYRQQQEDWVRAKLRKESGAVIGDDEMEREIKVYFPQPGDGKDVIEKKAQSRRVAIAAMRKSGGRAIDEGAEPAPSTGGAMAGWSIKVKP